MRPEKPVFFLLYITWSPKLVWLVKSRPEPKHIIYSVSHQPGVRLGDPNLPQYPEEITKTETAPTRTGHACYKLVLTRPNGGVHSVPHTHWLPNWGRNEAHSIQPSSQRRTTNARPLRPYLTLLGPKCAGTPSCGWQPLRRPPRRRNAENTTHTCWDVHV